MKLTRYSFASAACLAAVLALLHVGHAQAGPAEDYAEGSKQYAAGDLLAAMPLLQRAADAGHAAAQAAMGEILEQADDPEAVEYYRKSAAQGNANGQFGLGTMIAAGQVTPKNPADARKWITLAAEQGHKLAINELALAYIVGGLDIPEDARQSATALRWIRAAADDGYLTAMEKMSAAYRRGELGLAVDAKAADQWAEKIRKARGIRAGRRGNRSTNQ